MSIFQLNLAKHSTNPTILSSLAWNAIRDELEMVGLWSLMESIQSVKVTDTRVTIRTGKPIVNTELSHHREHIMTRITESFSHMGAKRIERKIVFL